MQGELNVTMDDVQSLRADVGYAVSMARSHNDIFDELMDRVRTLEAELADIKYRQECVEGQVLDIFREDEKSKSDFYTFLTGTGGEK